ncbi:MAG: taurine ABC transporter permease [Alteromonadaceae bacterium]|uniref:Taurine ABC transporter permease n=2 Tax=Hydrocarboniclastica marina TaxID=2259620 RepID=A0A4P7XL90_9ALTE|nr:taurine ABC transporter permease [Alteromonadaceae bacterium]QCF28009.1 taurine ABC transporter permease [Hydrocarboniclastica marina]
MTLGVVATAVFFSTSAIAKEPVKLAFQLDWRIEGPTAPFFLADAKGYFKEEGLDMTFDSGSGSGNTINRVAAGAYDLGFGDVNALVEYLANNPNSPRLRAVFMTYDASPAAVIALKSSGIRTPSDLDGKTLAAPSFDGARRAWPMFAEANGLSADAVSWQTVDPTLRETLLIRGDVDAISGYVFSSIINLEARGVRREDLVVMPYPEYGANLYGNAIIVSDRLIESNPEAIAGFLRAYTRGLRDVISSPDASIEFVRQRDSLIDVATEQSRLHLTIESTIDTPATRENGIGDVNMERLQRTIDQVALAYELPSGNVPEAEAVFDSSFLPEANLRRIFD